MTDLTPESVLTLPPCVTAREAEAVALFVEQAMVAAVARDREGLVEAVAQRLAEYEGSAESYARSPDLWDRIARRILDIGAQS